MMVKGYINHKMKRSLGIYVLFVILTFFTTSLLAQPNNQGFFLDSWMPKTIEVTAYDSIAQTTESATVTINIDASNVTSKVSKYAFGHNAGLWGGKLEKSPLAVKHITNLKPNIIRWPGGNISNDYFWDASDESTLPSDLPPDFVKKAHIYGSNENSWTMSVNSFYKTLEATNSKGIICVNYAYARYGTGEDPVLTAAKYAADWVRYDNGRTKFWEIGNENYGSWETGYEIDTDLNQDGQPKEQTGALYGQHCKVFISEMRKAAKEVGNDIKIGLVVYHRDDINFDAVKEWNEGVMSESASVADFLVPHKYFVSKTETDANVILNTASVGIKHIQKMLNAELKAYANLDPMPLALTEYNIWAEGQMQLISQVGGMHTALVMGSLISNGFGAGNRWDFMNAWSEGDNKGLFADGDPGIPRYTPRGTYFYPYFMQKYFGDKVIENTVAGSDNVECFTSRFSSGQVGVVLINKGTTDKVASLSIDNFRQGNKYYYYLLTGEEGVDYSRKVYVNGVTTTQYPGGGPENYEELKPFGTTINGDVKLKIPKQGTLFVLLENDKNLATQTISFDALEDKMIGDDDFNLTANSSAGLPVEFASSNSKVAIVKDGKVNVIGAGSCQIIAFQDGNESYLPASQIMQDLNVSKGDQSILFSEISEKGVDEADFEAGAISSSGLLCAYTSSNTNVAKIVDGKIEIVGEGTSIVTAHQSGNVNYNAAVDVSQELLVSINTGIHENFNENTFEVYPNPADDFVKISFSHNTSAVRIYNSKGVLVYENVDVTTDLNIPTNQIGASGIYFITANSTTKKIVIR
jgi:hypothetical protein